MQIICDPSLETDDFLCNIVLNVKMYVVSASYLVDIDALMHDKR